ncbi:alkaline phosphatase family protein [Lysinibacillus sp. 38-6]|uniref:alkaline phosphatase family protein n=1 Tax=Lysinibacillus sp. 38-6 TaxID=3385991 RepID=UPI0039088C7A
MKRSLYVRLVILIFCFFSFMNDVEAMENHEANRKVILISFDGMKNDYTNQYVQENKLPHIQQLLENGVTAKNPMTITPSLTAPSHAAIATGATPKETGIVSNHFHEPSTALEKEKSGFRAEIEVPPLWVEARKQGKTTATVAFPGANPKEGKQGDYSIYFGKTWSPSRLETLTFHTTTAWSQTPTSFSAIKEAKFSINMKKEKNRRIIYVLALDSTNDQQQNYDTFVFSEDRKVDNTDFIVKGNEWGSLSLDLKDQQSAGFWFKMKGNNEDLSQPVKLYRTAVTSSLISGPKGFAEEIDKQFGFYPVQDDDRALDKGWITRKEYEEISTRSVMWVTNVSLYIKQHYNPDLLMFYAPQIDHEQHKYLLIDPRQPDYSDEKSKQYMRYIEWSYQLADEIVGKTLQTLQDDDALFVVSDHGMEPAHSTLSPNKVLLDAGLLTVDEKNNINYDKSKAYAIPSGSVAHVYINLKHREKGGIVPPDEYEQVRDQIMQAFNEVEVTYNKGAMIQQDTKKLKANFSLTTVQHYVKDIWSHLMEPRVHPYESVLKNDNINLLEHQNAGDVVLIGAPGYVMGSDIEKNVTPPIQLGTHGGDATRSMLRPVFMATGQDFYKDKKLNATSNLDIAPTIYHILELDIPPFVEGEIITGLFNEKTTLNKGND